MKSFDKQRLREFDETEEMKKANAFCRLAGNQYFSLRRESKNEEIMSTNWKKGDKLIAIRDSYLEYYKKGDILTFSCFEVLNKHHSLKTCEMGPTLKIENFQKIEKGSVVKFASSFGIVVSISEDNKTLTVLNDSGEQQIKCSEVVSIVKDTSELSSDEITKIAKIATKMREDLKNIVVENSAEETFDVGDVVRFKKLDGGEMIGVIEEKGTYDKNWRCIKSNHYHCRDISELQQLQISDLKENEIETIEKLFPVVLKSFDKRIDGLEESLQNVQNEINRLKTSGEAFQIKLEQLQKEKEKREQLNVGDKVEILNPFVVLKNWNTKTNHSYIEFLMPNGDTFRTKEVLEHIGQEVIVSNLLNNQGSVGVETTNNNKHFCVPKILLKKVLDKQNNI